jgi:hypothetical protein
MPKLRTAALVALALVPVACGGGSAGDDGDPATLVPADASMYAEVVVRPDGSQREEALEAAGKVLRTDDPEAEIRRLLQRPFAQVEFDYDRDVEPWLGERMGLWANLSDEDTPFGVMLLAATDTDRARSALEDSMRRNDERFTERTHRGSEYLLDDDGFASGIVGDFVVFGPEAAFKRTVDAAEGDSLAEAERYSDAVGRLEDERLAHFWLDSAALFEQGLAADPELRAQGEQLSAILPFDELPPVAGSFTADGDGLRLEARARSGERRGFGSVLGGGSSPLVQELPGDSWLALGSADVGESLRETIDGLGGAFGGIAIRRELQQETGLDLDRDLLDWIGHVGLFVRGTTLETLDGGMVIQPTDEDRAADAFGRIVGAIQVAAKVRARPVDVAGADQAFEIAEPGSPQPVVLARGSGLVAITIGRPAAEAALGSDDRLGDTNLYSEAEDLVGMEPSALLSMDRVIEIAAANPDPDFEEARPYLEAFSVIALGVTVDGDEGIARLGGGLE